MTTINTFILFPKVIKTAKIDAFLSGLKNVNAVFVDEQEDHHRYVLETYYPDTLVKIGYWMANEESEIVERGK